MWLLINRGHMHWRWFILYLTCMCFCGFSAEGQKYCEMVKHTTTVSLGGVYDAKRSAFEATTSAFLDAINKAYCSNQQPNFPSTIATSAMDEKIGDIWAISPFASVEPQIVRNVLSNYQGNYEIRNLQIVLEEADSGYVQQDGVLFFDPNGKIIDFKIGLKMHDFDPIIRSNINVTDLRRRQMIVSFVEDFRTSYNLKDLDFLNKVFSEKALIITGKVLKETLEDELKPRIVYKRQTKQQYLANLRSIFSRTKMLSINFDSIKVVMHPKLHHIYGVNLYQTWNSEYVSGGRYNDIGYVFLIIDFANEAKPKIWVRTWADKDLFSLDNFPLQ